MPDTLEKQEAVLEFTLLCSMKAHQVTPFLDWGWDTSSCVLVKLK